MRKLIPDTVAVMLLKIIIPMLILVLSYFVLSTYVSSDKYTGKYMETIEASKDSVLKLTASATSVSVAISALPGDLATPVAEKLADLSMGFMIVLCAIYLEKFLITITGLVVFKWMIPIACVLYVIGTFVKKEFIRVIAYKIAIVAIAIVVIIPASVSVTKVIRDSYGDTIDETIESAQKSASLMRESMADDDVDENTANGLGKIIESLKQSGDVIANGTSEFMRYLEKLSSRFVEAVAILIVTSCIMPLLVILAIAWLIKAVFLQNIKLT